MNARLAQDKGGANVSADFESSVEQFICDLRTCRRHNIAQLVRDHFLGIGRLSVDQADYIRGVIRDVQEINKMVVGDVFRWISSSRRDSGG